MKILRSFGYTSAGTFIGYIINFISGIILARTIGPEGIGVVQLAIFIPWLILVLTSGGIKLSNIHFIGSGKETTNNIIGYNLFFILFHTLVIIPVYIFLIIPILSDIYKDKIPLIILYSTTIMITINLIFYYFQGILIGLEKIKEYVFSELIKSLVYIIVIGVIFSLFTLNPFIVYQGFIAGALLGTLFIIYVISRYKYKFHIFFNKNRMTELLAFGMKGQFATIFNVMNLKLDVFIIAYFLEADRLGIYTIAVSLTNILIFIPNSLINILMPKAADSAKLKDYLPQIIRIVTALMVVFSLFLLALGKLIILFLYSSKFIDAYILLIVLLPGSIFLGINQMVTSSLTGKGIPSVQSIAAGLGFIMTLLFDFVLIPEIGVLGAAIASSISYISMGLTSMYFLNKYEHIPISNLFIFEKADFILVNSRLKKLLSFRNGSK